MKIKPGVILLLAVNLISFSFGFAGGDGTEANPYQISCFEDINSINNNLSAHYIMVNDIDLSGMVFNYSLVGKEDPYSTPFSGSFDGNNYKITGLTIEAEESAALFASISSAYISNCSVTGKITKSDTSGIVFYAKDSTITNCSFTGELSDSHSTAGILNYGKGVVISNCSVNAAIKNNRYASGIASYVSCSKILNCSFTGEISKSERSAGIILSMDNYYYINNKRSIISNCHVKGIISDTGYTGGLAQSVKECSITDSSFNGTIDSIHTGGIVSESGSDCEIINCSFEGDITSCYSGGGIVQYAKDDITINNCSFSGKITQNSTSNLFDKVKNGNTEYHLEFVRLLDTSYHGGLVGYSEDSAEIRFSTFNGNISGPKDYTGGIIGYAGNDVDIIYCRVNTEIENLSSGSKIGGVISEFPAGRIGGCVVDANIISNGCRIGGIAALSKGLILYCDTTLNTSGRHTIGGIAGRLEGQIENCNATVNISGERNIGGIAGCTSYGSDSHINYCNTFGTIQGSFENIGGIVGESFGAITNCKSFTNISSENDNAYVVGGIAGIQFDEPINNCIFEGSINGSSSLGGICGKNFSSITNCYSKSNLTGYTDIGGIAGRNEGKTPTIKNCYWDGQINSENKEAAGLIGDYTSGNVINCYSKGSIFVNQRQSNALIGIARGNPEESIITNSYYLIDEFTDLNDPWYYYHYPTNRYGIPFTDEQLKVKANFTDWDFDTVWRMCEDNIYYPALGFYLESKGDFLCNRGVDTNDLEFLINDWLRYTGYLSGETDYTVTDLNKDKIVDFIDFAILANNWLK